MNYVINFQTAWVSVAAHVYVDECMRLFAVYSSWCE